MRGIVYETGGVSALTISQLPDPTPGPGEVVIRVAACAMNHLDVWATGGSSRIGGRGPRIMGADVAGVVHDVGAGVTAWKPGDRVLVYPGYGCGNCKQCQRGNHAECPQYRLVGVGVDGGYSELMKTEARNLMPLPANVGFQEGASFPLVFITAWHMLIAKARVEPGEWVLVNAAGSGVGIAAIQIAKMLGAKVATTASTQIKRDKGVALGADVAVDYTKPGWPKEVMELTSGGVDVCIDSVGGKTIGESVEAMARSGRIVNCGATAGPMEVSLDALRSRRLSFMPSFMGSNAYLHPIMRLASTGELKPVIHRVFPFEQVQEAHRTMLNRDNFGKIVLTW